MIDLDDPPAHLKRKAQGPLTETRPLRAGKIASINKLDMGELPEVPDRYAMPGAVVVAETTLDVSSKLHNLTELALLKAEEILQLPLHQDDADFATILRAQAQQVQTIFTAQLRADEGKFRKVTGDNLGKLLELLRDEEAKLLTIEDGARRLN